MLIKLTRLLSDTDRFTKLEANC